MMELDTNLSDRHIFLYQIINHDIFTSLYVHFQQIDLLMMILRHQCRQLIDRNLNRSSLLFIVFPMIICRTTDVFIILRKIEFHHPIKIRDTDIGKMKRRKIFLLDKFFRPWCRIIGEHFTMKVFYPDPRQKKRLLRLRKNIRHSCRSKALGQCKNHNFDFPPIVFSSLAVLENCTPSLIDNLSKT